MSAASPWAQFPPDEPPASGPVLSRSRPAQVGAATLLMVAGASLTGSVGSAGAWLLLLAVTVCASVAMAALADDLERPPDPAIAAVGGAVAGAILVDPVAGLSMLVTGLVAMWACFDRHPPQVPAIDAEAAPTIVASTVGMAVLGAIRSDAPAALLLGVPVATLVIAVVRPHWTRRAGDALGRGAVVVAGVLVRVLIGLVGLVIIGIPWLLQRATRWDPTWVPRAPATRWVARTSVDGRDDRLWDPDPRVLRTTPGRRLHRLGVSALIVVLVAATAGLVAARIEDQQFRAKFEQAPALDGSPWVVELQRAVDEAFARADITSYYGVSLPDTRSEFLNIRDGVRATWQPPASPCRPLRIWMFGGSAMFGLGQRDDGTIASWLARLAWEEGLPLAIENRGVPADVHWIAGRRIEDAVLSGAEPPDRVVFYDGTNDLDVQSYLNSVGLGGARLLASYPDGKELRSLQSDKERLAALSALAHSGPEITKTTHPPLAPEPLADFAAEGYRAAGALSSDFLADQGIAETWFYQPSLASRRTPVPGEDVDGGDPYRRELEAAFRAQLPDGVVDLSGAMDEVSAPVYYDWVHTNEEGARIVAAAMLEHLRPELEADLEAQGVGSCR